MVGKQPRPGRICVPGHLLCFSKQAMGPYLRQAHGCVWMPLAHRPSPTLPPLSTTCSIHPTLRVASTPREARTCLPTQARPATTLEMKGDEHNGPGYQAWSSSELRSDDVHGLRAHPGGDLDLPDARAGGNSPRWDLRTGGGVLCGALLR